MCIIIDTNTLACVFNRACSKHSDFKPVLDWILFGKGIIVYGGKKYKKELSSNKYLEIIIELKNVRKAINVNDKKVDEEQAKIEELINPQKFDDAHLSAIVIVSDCRIICTEDVRSLEYIKERRWYPKHIKKPKIYCAIKNKNLLCDKYIADDYKRYQKINKTMRATIERALKEI